MTQIRNFIIAIGLCCGMLRSIQASTKNALTIKDTTVQIEYVAMDSVEKLGTIIGSYAPKEFLTDNDVVYLEMPGLAISPGDRFTAYRDHGKIPVPGQAFASFGRRIQIIGFLRVTRVLPTMIEAKVYDTVEDLNRGTPIMALTNTRFQIAPKEPENSLEGVVLGQSTIAHLSGSYEMAFLNKGTEDGVKLNDRYFVVRKGTGPKELKDKLPDIEIAEIVIVHAANRVSTAYVRSASETFESGARFKSAKSEVTYLDQPTPSLEVQVPAAPPPQ